MQRPKVLVTGATGKTGGAVVRELLARGFPVRAVVHREDARSTALAKRGAEVAVADLFDPEQMLHAARGTQRAYYLPVFHTHMIQSAVVFALVAREARLESVVHTGQWLSHHAHPAAMTRQTWLVDRLFAEVPGLAHTTLNPGLFADNFLRVIDYAALLGFYPVLTGGGRAAPVSNEDVARVAAAALADPAPHDGKTYRPTGPVAMSGREMAAVLAGVVGHRVLPVDLPFWVFQKVARQQGVDPLEVSGYRHYVEEMRRGAFMAGGGVNDVVRALCGEPAESFETTARRYAAQPFARPTWRNRLRALARFALVPFYPGYDVETWERAKGLPRPASPRLSIDDARWRASHGAAPIEPERAASPAVA